VGRTLHPIVLGSPTSGSRVLRSPTSSTSTPSASALDPPSLSCSTYCPSSDPSTNSYWHSRRMHTFSMPTSTRLSIPMSYSYDGAGYVIVILPSMLTVKVECL
jgi:hypothetical protein